MHENHNYYNNLLLSFSFFWGGRYYEDKRDESSGQGSKTVWTGWQSRLKIFLAIIVICNNINYV